MGTTLLTTGLACILAAIVGGGLKAFGIEISILKSGKRQALLAIFGLILLVGAYTTSSRWEMSGLEFETDRYGGQDYNNFYAADVRACSETCLADPKCMSFSYNGPANQCWLKADVPLRRENRIFTSATKIAKPWWKLW